MLIFFNEIPRNLMSLSRAKQIVLSIARYVFPRFANIQSIVQLNDTIEKVMIPRKKISLSSLKMVFVWSL